MSFSNHNAVPDACTDVHLQSSLHEKYLALPLPLSPHTTLHVRITALRTSNMIFLTTTDFSPSSSSSALGSFIYAMPNVSMAPELHFNFMHSNQIRLYSDSTLQMSSAPPSSPSRAVSTLLLVLLRSWPADRENPHMWGVALVFLELQSKKRSRQ